MRSNNTEDVNALREAIGVVAPGSLERESSVHAQLAQPQSTESIQSLQEKMLEAKQSADKSVAKEFRRRSNSCMLL
jgi:hypothetical protein